MVKKLYKQPQGKVYYECIHCARLISNKQNLKKHYADGTYDNTRCWKLNIPSNNSNFKYVGQFDTVAM